MDGIRPEQIDAVGLERRDASSESVVGSGQGQRVAGLYAKEENSR